MAREIPDRHQSSKRKNPYLEIGLFVTLVAIAAVAGVTSVDQNTQSDDIMAAEEARSGESAAAIDDVSWNTYEAGEPLGDDWFVVAGHVDAHAADTHQGFDFAVEGDYIDLNGAGHIERTVDVIAGAHYNLSVDIGENPGGPPVKQMQIIWNGTVISTLNIDVPRGELETYTVQLPMTVSSTATLEFKSIDMGVDSRQGPVIDNPTLTYIPNPD